MKNQLFIPQKINIGFQNRTDTYTKMLAYVIYYDNKGVLRKEKSWQSWRDKKIKSIEYENKPTEGFVLNKGVGGARHSYGWNARNEYVRVFDPRGFEFEISVANLLFILQETNSIKGKGLEGEFVYGWGGTELALLPISCEEYKNCVQYTDLQNEKITTKQLIPGCSYKTKKQEDLIYMGKFNWYSTTDWYYREEDSLVSVKKVFVFIDSEGNPITLSGLTSLALQNTTEPVDNYAELMDKLSKDKHMSSPIDLISKTIDFDKIFTEKSSDTYTAYIPINEYSYKEYYIQRHKTYNYELKDYTKEDNYYISHSQNIKFSKDKLLSRENLKSKNSGYSYYNQSNSCVEKNISKDKIKEYNFVDLYVKLESKKVIKLYEYYRGY